MEFESNHNECNLQTVDHPLRNLESAMSRRANILSKSNLKGLVNRLEALQNKPLNKELSPKERYELAWKISYQRLPEYRQKEIDESLKCGKFGECERDNDFIRQITSLAESDSALEVSELRSI
jgi:hypothetical protein